MLLGGGRQGQERRPRRPALLEVVDECEESLRKLLRALWNLESLRLRWEKPE
jgi:hypothetical protein